MKKMLCALFTCLLLVSSVPIGLAEAPSAEWELFDYETPFLWEENSDTILALQQECEHKGEVVTLDYPAPAYAINEVLGRHEKLNKSVTVYLPYGYDETQQYDVLYLLHGTGGNNEYWLMKEKTGIPTVNVLDNLIDQGIIKPLIVVTPDWNADLKGKKNKIEDSVAAAYAEKIGESGIGKRNDLWCLFFDQELVNDIIPLVEGCFSTYAGGDTSAENLTATRDHRALAGLSRGSVATLRSMLSHCDFFAWFGCFSGGWINQEQFKQAVLDTVAADRPIRYWYNGNGTEDFSLDSQVSLVNMARTELTDCLTDGENMAFVVKEGSAHTYENWLTDLYNILIVFFN